MVNSGWCTWPGLDQAAHEFCFLQSCECKCGHPHWEQEEE